MIQNIAQQVFNFIRKQRRWYILIVLTICSLFSFTYFPVYNIVKTEHGRTSLKINIMKSYQIEWNEYQRFDRNLLTLFTTWGNDRNKTNVIRNTIQNWRSLGPSVTPLLFANTSVQEQNYAKVNGWINLPVATATDNNIPLFKSMFKQAMKTTKTDFYGYSNSDILFSPLLIKTLLAILPLEEEKKRPILIVGRRTDFEISKIYEYENVVLRYGIDFGTIGRDDSVDYFIISPDFPLDDLAEVVVGRIGYDNYIIMHARANRALVIDVTESNPSVHQTTGAGNLEGHLHRNKYYNIDLLKKTLDITNYEGGLISCSSYATNYSIIPNEVIVYKRASKSPQCIYLCQQL